VSVKREQPTLLVLGYDWSRWWPSDETGFRARQSNLQVSPRAGEG